MSSRASTTAATPALSSPTMYEAQPRSSWVIWRNSMSALLPLALGYGLGQPPRAKAALDAGEGGRRERSDGGPRAQAERSDVDLAAVLLGPADHRLRHLVRSARADPARQPHPRVGEHARVGDEAREDDRHPDPGAAQVLAQARGKAAQAELGGGVQRGADRSDLPRQRRDEHHVSGAALEHAGQQRPRQLDRGTQV